MNIALNSALQGIEAAQARLDRSASKIIHATSVDGSGDMTDLSAAMVELMQSRDQNAVGVKVSQTADDLQREAVNLLA